MKKDNEMKKYIQNWLASRKYHELKQKFDLLNKTNNMDKTIEELVAHTIQNGYSKEELLEVIERIFEYNALSDEEKAEFGLQFISINLYLNKEEWMRKFINTMLKWYTYLYIYQKMEEYEICAKLLQIIQIEKEEFLYALKQAEIEDDGFTIDVEENIYTKFFGEGN